MKLEEIKETDWYKERPTIIQKAIDTHPPTKLYKFKDSGHQCQLISYEEPENNKFEDITVTVQKTGIGGLMEQLGLKELSQNQVYGVKLETLEEWKD